MCVFMSPHPHQTRRHGLLFSATVSEPRAVSHPEQALCFRNESDTVPKPQIPEEGSDWPSVVKCPCLKQSADARRTDVCGAKCCLPLVVMKEGRGAGAR